MMGRSHFLEEKSILEVEGNRNILSLKGKITSCAFQQASVFDTTLNVWGLQTFLLSQADQFYWGTLINKIQWKLSIAGAMKRWITYHLI